MCSPLYGRNTRTLTAWEDYKAGEKKCPRCTRNKPLPEFYKRRDGRPSVYCKICAGDENLERQIALKHRAVEAKGGVCQRCGFNGPDVCFDFHHRDRSTKRFGISQTKKWKWEEVLKELEKCDLLCANCHRIVEYAPVAQLEERSATNGEGYAGSIPVGGTI